MSKYLDFFELVALIMAIILLFAKHFWPMIFTIFAKTVNNIKYYVTFEASEINISSFEFFVASCFTKIVLFFKKFFKKA